MRGAGHASMSAVDNQYEVKRIKDVRVMDGKVEATVEWEDSSVPIGDVHSELVRAYYISLAASNAAKLIQLARHNGDARRLAMELQASSSRLSINFSLPFRTCASLSQLAVGASYI
jgi:hypothetical protein